jgi:hypothetical protein
MESHRAAFSSVLAFAVCFLSTGLVRSQDPPPEEPKENAEKPAAPAAKEPEFKKSSAKDDFEKGKSLYNEGNYKDAEPLFRKAKAEAKEKDDKDIVESWAQAASGAQLLEKVKLRVKQRQLHQAYQEAEAYSRKYKDTPVEAEFKKFMVEIENEIFVSVETFDNPSNEYTEKFGKTFVKEPKLLLDGTPCLRWTNTADRKPAMLRVKGAPTDWTQFEAVEFFMNVTAAPGTPEMALISGESDASSKKKKAPKRKGAAEAPTDVLIAPLRLPSGTGIWQKVRIPMSEFKAQGEAKLSYVQAFQIQVAGGRPFDVLIDKILLVKKDGPAGGSAPDAKKKAGGKS